MSTNDSVTPEQMCCPVRHFLRVFRWRRAGNSGPEVNFINSGRWNHGTDYHDPPFYITISVCIDHGRSSPITVTQNEIPGFVYDMPLGRR